ncbi:MAG TPA: lipid-A-disaccharide synthase N-terminal domain-containing protein [bacterium]|nr:lipid-A-disaccharide synthase N-terminal domain-containing protein [bacterium]HOL96674.1 lipid-A-disaccharide synthase N-terminal domain-containing protein [bacterium]HPO99699.1 lipid-A-disaccharide synthase N-terminal domain-containing protein [bacterium]HXK92182.1 lipid-A-disaccharide synthase N-terminal domain-containing protein [bacterium]
MDSKLSQILSGGFGFWDMIAVLGLVTFSSRFIIQWIASEIRKESVIPVSFWYLSIVGSLLMLTYALHIADRWIILSYLFNCLIYFRNLYFIYTKKQDVKTGE